MVLGFLTFSSRQTTTREGSGSTERCSGEFARHSASLNSIHIPSLMGIPSNTILVVQPSQHEEGPFYKFLLLIDVEAIGTKKDFLIQLFQKELRVPVL
jgi:hypothetical protein